MKKNDIKKLELEAVKKMFELGAGELFPALKNSLVKECKTRTKKQNAKVTVSELLQQQS